MKITQTKLILFTAFFFVLFDNLAFFTHVMEVYPVSLKNMGFLLSLPVVLTSFIVLLLVLASSRYTIKPVLIFLLLLSSLAAYFMNNYSVVIDHVMIQNLVQTNINEAGDLFSLKLLFYFVLLGVLPAVFVFLVEIQPASWKRSIITKSVLGSSAVLVALAVALLFSKSYTSFAREHTSLRYYTNPTYYIYSVGKYINETYNGREVVVQSLGTDALVPVTDLDRELVILVVGEAVRADRLSLNGYERETTPFLQNEDVVSFSRMYSCGTSTAYSVPCMFSIFPRGQFSNSKGASSENLLDVLKHAGVNVLWRDNNSDSKGVASRVEYQDYKKPELNPVCDSECRDVGMLVGLQEYIDEKQEGDIFIVLHQMGNHGPAYYKRYPEDYERYTPVCRSNQFEECTNEEINNAYDNAILYTDYFLSQVIELLKKNTGRFETAMVYMSDHGESLGEHNIYLHGLPYAMAPEVQTHIGSVFWLGNGFKLDKKALRDKSAINFSQDNLFHTVLGLLEIETEVYDKNLDMINYDNYQADRQHL
jgi:lipid A ethanolaminephosphotransferase